MVGMDVSDDKPPDPFRADLRYSRADRMHRIVRVHATVEEVDVEAINEQEDVDETILERDGQAELEHSLGHFAQCDLNHVPGIVQQPPAIRAAVAG